jgi:hypothetical protein
VIRALPLHVPAALLLALAPHAAAAQGWVLDAAAGRTAHEAAAGGEETLAAILGLRYDGLRWAAFAASVPLEAGGSAWAAAAAGGRLGGGGTLAAGADVAVHGYGFRGGEPGTGGGGMTVAALPLLAVQRGGGRLELRSGVVHHHGFLAGEASPRTVHQSDARLAVWPAGVRMGLEGRYLRAAEGGYPYAGGEVEAAVGTATLWASAGSWLSSELREPVWGGGARVRVAAATELFAAYRRQGTDPLYWTEPRSTWSVGVTRRLGGAAALAAARPSIAPEVRGGRTVFRLPLSASREAPAVAGDFNGWVPVRMAREGDSWTVSIPVPRGIHRYAYRRGDGRWFVPEGTPGRAPDGFGGVSAVLVVP